MLNVLVTGAGGGVGQGVIKSLKMISDLDINVVAADMSELAVGLYAGDKAYLVDACTSPNYLQSLGVIFKNESVDYYFPGTDVELAFCAKQKDQILKEYGVKTVISSIQAVEIADDKYKTYAFLNENGFSCPKTQWLKDFLDNNEIDFPVIIKPAIGCRSIGVFKVNNEKELSQYASNPDGIVVQEIIGDEDSEFTCTVVKVGDHLSPVIALKRVLRSGDTYRADPIQSDVIETYVHDVATELDIDGACNFQLRLDSMGVPKIFEINCRYSGTTPFCAQLGFNPVEYYLKKILNQNYVFSMDYDSVVFRYWSEVVVKKEELSIVVDRRAKTPHVNKQFSLF